MEDHDKKKKSPHLQQLEEAFEKRTRRFSAFEILGLTPEGDQKAPEDQPSQSGPSVPASGSDEPSPTPDDPTHDSSRHTDGSKRHMGVSNIPISESTEHIPPVGVSGTPPYGSDIPTGGVF